MFSVCVSPSGSVVDEVLPRLRLRVRERLSASFERAPCSRRSGRRRIATKLKRFCGFW